MSDITLMDVLYTGGMLFLIFYGSLFLTKVFAGKEDDSEEKKEEGTSEDRSEK